MRKRSLLTTLAIVMALAIVALFAFNAAIAKPNPPGCKNEVPGPNGFKNPNCQPEGPEFGNCDDGIDNDQDGLTDGADPDCQTPPPPPACNDGADNDGDGKTDFPADPGCTSADDTDETDPVTQPACNDGVDNDGDGKIDAADPGCSSPDDTDETDPTTTTDPCTGAHGDEGLIGPDTIAQQLWDGGLDALSPLTEDPDRDGAISGPLGDAFQPPDGPLAPLEPVGDEVSCLVDLLIDASLGGDL